MKPPYMVPTMEEIRLLPWNGFRVASTFSGCGGSSLGYRMAGYRVVYASEFIPAARETYAANMAPGTVLDERDIRTVAPAEILSAIGLSAGELDLLDGSPPCSSFSTAGKREKHWGQEKRYSDTVQRTDDLFFEFARILRDVQPRAFVAENVSGLVKGTAKGYFIEILRELKSCGYTVEARLLDAQWLGVPQTRARLIFVGVRDDLGVEPAFPSPLPYRYSIRDAIPWLSGVGTRDGVRPATEPAVQTHGNRFTRSELTAVDDTSALDISRFAIGREWNALRPGESSRKYFNLVRPDENRPCPAICAEHGQLGIAGVTHPNERRKFTIAELRRICSFPDDFALTGTYAQQWERMGRAVPPLMMRAIATAVRDRVLSPLRAAGRI